MAIYPYGTPASGVYDIFQTSFSPNDVVRAIRDNYSPVNRTTMLNSLGYQVGLLQNYINATYMGRRTVPVENAFMTSGWCEDLISYSGTLTENEILLALSNSSSADAHQYTHISDGRIDVKSFNGGGESTALCGHAILRPTEFVLSQYAAIGSNTEWSGVWNLNGITSYQLTFSSPQTSNGFISNFRANRAHKLTVANPSYQDDGVGFSGILELYARDVRLSATNWIQLATRPSTSVSYIAFCGTSLVVSGNAASSYILFQPNLIPITNNATTLGDQFRYFSNAYINRTNSSIIALDGGATSKQWSYWGNFGGVCGQHWSTDVFGLSVYLDHVCGRVIHNRTFISPNKIALYAYDTDDTIPASGYFQMISGQLEFYSYNHGSGWVITAF